MSENAIIVVELSLSAAEAPERIAAAKKLLLDEGIVVPNERRDALWQPSEYRAGPRAIEVAPALAHEHIRKLANNGVDFVCERQVHHGIENYEPPQCPACHVASDPDAHSALVEPWLEGGEPSFVCQACGAANLVGDWVGKFTFQVGEAAVRFNNWSDVDTAFLAKLGASLGPRARIVYEHS